MNEYQEYQEALDNLIKVSCPKKTCCNDCVMKQICNCKAKEYIDTLQELIDKVTPKKPIERHYEDEGEPEYIKVCCPAGCKVQVGSYYNFCPECGQALDWSDD